jgi:Family of unknown function (DUF6624)
VRKKVPALLLFAALAISSANALTPVPRQQTSSIVPGARTGHNEALAHEITQLFNEDQGMISDLESARKDPAFEQTYQSYAHRVEVELNDPNFFFAALFELWAQEPGAPDVVRRYVKFHKSTDTRIESIVTQYGWPQRASVGDEAAAQFFFLFGHADDQNPWRVTQQATLDKVFREDHVTPRMYAHLCDRLANVAGKPQIYGTIMGPNPATPGAAKLYWPLSGTIDATDKRRAQIGLPSIEDDLEKFRQGATIGPYMTPLTKGMQWTIADVYTSSS